MSSTLTEAAAAVPHWPCINLNLLQNTASLPSCLHWNLLWWDALKTEMSFCSGMPTKEAAGFDFLVLFPKHSGNWCISLTCRWGLGWGGEGECPSRHLDMLEAPMVQQMMSFYKEDKMHCQGAVLGCALSWLCALITWGWIFRLKWEKRGWLLSPIRTEPWGPSLSEPGLMRLQDDLPFMLLPQDSTGCYSPAS